MDILCFLQMSNIYFYIPWSSKSLQRYVDPSQLPKRFQWIGRSIPRHPDERIRYNSSWLPSLVSIRKEAESEIYSEVEGDSTSSIPPVSGREIVPKKPWRGFGPNVDFGFAVFFCQMDVPINRRGFLLKAISDYCRFSTKNMFFLFECLKLKIKTC